MMEKQRWAIFDLDGTIADIGYRLQQSTVKGKLDYKKLHDPSLIQFDEPMYKTIDLIRDLKSFNVKIFILTARFASTEKATIEWLDKHEVYFDQLLMKSSKDVYMKSDKWKEKEMLRFMQQDYLRQVILAADDYKKNQFMFESYDIPCLDPIEAELNTN